MRLRALAVVCFLLGCSAPIEQPTDDGSVRDALVDARADASSDPLHCDAEGNACRAFERCVQGACTCAGAEPWCGTAGYASFPFPDPSAMQTGYVIDGDVVRDTVSGLVWERGTVGTKRTWDDAVAYCEGLTLGGRDDYRLPSRVELASVLDPSRTPSIAADFAGVFSDYYWTASRPAFSTALAYSMYFGLGEIVTATAASPGAYVRCVAGTLGEVGFMVSEHEARDVATGLVWERASRGALTFDAAEAACLAETRSGRTWRLPTATELATIVDESRTPAIDPELFGAGEASWSATTRDFGELTVWVVRFDVFGALELVPGDAERAFRCVAEP